MKKYLIKALLITGFLSLQTISYGLPKFQLRLDGPEELKFKLEEISISAPRSSELGNIAGLADSARQEEVTYTSQGPHGLLTSTSDIPLKNLNPSAPKNLMKIKFYKKDKLISEQELELKKEQQTITIGDQETGEYTIDMQVKDKDPGPNVEYDVRLKVTPKSS